MFKFEYTTVNYREFLTDYAAAMGTVLNEEDRLFVPEHIGKGYLQLIDLPNGLQAIVMDYSINDGYYIKRISSKEEDYYTLRYDEITITDKLTLQIDSQIHKETGDRHASIYLTSTLFDVAYLSTKGAAIKGMHIIFSKEWLAKNLGIKNTEQVLTTYISLKTASFNIEPIDAEYKKYFNEILDTDAANPMRLAIIQNRIMLIIERFFSRLYEKSQSLTRHLRISKHDINSLMDIEQILTRDLTVSPPTIEELASNAAMSPAKLKRIFKDVYGSGIYSYYQKQRMQKAREMLLTGDYSVKEVGIHVGYANLSNFATAFKKEFGILPSEARQRQ